MHRPRQEQKSNETGRVVSIRKRTTTTTVICGKQTFLCTVLYLHPPTATPTKHCKHCNTAIHVSSMSSSINSPSTQVTKAVDPTRACSSTFVLGPTTHVADFDGHVHMRAPPTVVLVFHKHQRRRPLRHVGVVESFCHPGIDQTIKVKPSDPHTTRDDFRITTQNPTNIPIYLRVFIPRR